jgi:DNA-directed RNA polymerase subunit RPC12/RpoP
MEVKKYQCRQCAEQFNLSEKCRNKPHICPRCSSKDIADLIACKIEIGSPPWEYLCQKCGCKFSVQSPSGPDEAKQIKCPVCASPEVKWLALASETCPPGG